MLLLLAFLAGPARAGSSEVFGFGAASIGRGGAGMGLVDGPEGLFLDPAGLSAMPAARVVLGGGLVRARFDPIPPVWWDTNRDGRISEDDEPLRIDPTIDPADGFTFAVGRPIGGRFGLGFAAWLPVDRLLRIRTFEPAIPEYFMFANRLHRYEAVAGFGWEHIPGVSVGGAVEIIARARYTMSIGFSAAVSGADGTQDQLGEVVGDLEMDVHEIGLDLVPGLAPVASLRWDVGRAVPALDGLVLSGAWRGSSGLPVDIDVDIQVDLTVEEMGELQPLVFSALMPMELAFIDHYVPERLSLGVGWRRPGGALSLDVRRTAWDRLEVNVARVVASTLEAEVISLDDPEIRDGNGFYALFRPTWSVRVGGELGLPVWRPGGDLGTLRGIVRAGAGWEPTPLVEQGSSSALLDSDRLIGSGGLGVEHGDPFGIVEGPVRWDLYGQVQLLAPGSLDLGDTMRPGAPVDGAAIPIGGRVWTCGLEWSMDY